MNGGSLHNSHPPPASSSSHNSGAVRATLTPAETPTAAFSQLQTAAGTTESHLPAPPDPRVQICPHETLSFDRLQRILALPNFKDVFLNKTLDALTANCTPSQQHDFSPGSYTRTCRLPQAEGSCYTSPQGTFVYHYDHNQRGLSLHSNWTFTHTPSAVDDSYGTLRRFLDHTGVWLCPHRRLGDPVVAEALHGRLHPDQVMDPVEQYEVQARSRDNCEACETGFEMDYGPGRLGGHQRVVTVSTARFVGGAEAVDDPVWRAQCGM